ncbi:MAG: dethiobiotin synthase [Methylophilus sp.]|jgi:dethiobiotin synthetase
MQQSFFITGTDTEVGKTYIACKLIKHYVALGYKVVGMKPVAAGCDWVDGAWLNEDVKLLTAASNVQAPTHLVNPYSFKEPIAPHIAAQHEGVTIDLQVIVDAYQQLTQLADIVIVEGAGGLLVPLGDDHTLADLVAQLNIPIILVIGLKLGCINHALLTYEVIQQRQLKLDSWLANPIDSSMLASADNLHTLKHKLAAVKQLVLD